jgi:hypothetical protein
MKNKRSFFETLAAIAWSFIGLRRKKDFEIDAEGKIDPLYMIIAAAIGVAVFIGLLMLAVHLAVGK